MAIDSENKRRNVLNISTPFLFLGLITSNGIDTSDKENLSEVYIGFEYGAGASESSAVRSKIRINIGLGF